jgi:hypothetical protein
MIQVRSSKTEKRERILIVVTADKGGDNTSNYYLDSVLHWLSVDSVLKMASQNL